MDSEEVMAQRRQDSLDKRNRYDAEAEADLRPHLTPEILDVMRRAAHATPWVIDASEVFDFVVWCYKVAGVELPFDLTQAGRFGPEWAAAAAATEARLKAVAEAAEARQGG